MGCFDMICAVSGLPITGGEKVLYYLLTENPYEQKASACYVWDRWFPRTFPLKATYNSYGSVENVEEGPMREVWLRALEHDLYEVGLGDNTVHDVPVRRGIGFEDLLEAVWEGRLQVQRDVGYGDIRENEEKLGLPRPQAEGVPSLLGIEAALRAAGLPVTSRADEAGYVVDEVCWGRVCIRYRTGSYETALAPEALEAALGAASDAVGPGFARAVWAASRSYDSFPYGELVVRPRIGTPNFHGDGHPVDQRPLRVSHAMVRQDVWDLLMRQRISRWDVKLSFRQYREGVREYWSELRSDKAKDQFERSMLLMRGDGQKDLETGKVQHGIGIFSRSLVPFTVGPAEHAKLLIDDPTLDHKGFAQRAAEFSYATAVMSSLNIGFRPSDTAGQCYMMRAWSNLLRGTSALAEKIARRNERERRKWDLPRKKAAKKKPASKP